MKINKTLKQIQEFVGVCEKEKLAKWHKKWNLVSVYNKLQEYQKKKHKKIWKIIKTNSKRNKQKQHNDIKKIKTYQ